MAERRFSGPVQALVAFLCSVGVIAIVGGAWAVGFSMGEQNAREEISEGLQSAFDDAGLTPTTAGALVTPPSTASPAQPLGSAQVHQRGETITVFGTQDPAMPGKYTADPDQGYRFVAVDIEVCAAASSAQLPTSDRDVTVRTDSGRVWESTFLTVVEPEFREGPVVAGECARGWVPYQVGLDESVTEVVFGRIDPLSWSVIPPAG